MALPAARPKTSGRASHFPDVLTLSSHTNTGNPHALPRTQLTPDGAGPPLHPHKERRATGIHFQGLRYLDPTLAAYVGEPVTIRYDPRDVAELRIFHDGVLLCRAICPSLPGAPSASKRSPPPAAPAAANSPPGCVSAPASSTGS
jgi:Mu transposase, C-terminal